MALISREMPHLSAERASPEDGIALIAGMAEIKGAGHFRYALRDHGLVSAITIRREHEGAAPDTIHTAVRSPELDTGDTPGRIDEQRRHPCACDDLDACMLGSRAQPIDQFRSGPARQPVHAL